MLCLYRFFSKWNFSSLWAKNPNFDAVKLSPNLKLSENTWVNGRTNMIGGAKDFITSCQVWYQKDPSLRVAFSSPNKLKEFLEEIGATWHHVEDLDTMILIPTEIHAGLIHFGGSSLLTGLKLFRANWNALIALGYE